MMQYTTNKIRFSLLTTTAIVLLAYSTPLLAQSLQGGKDTNIQTDQFDPQPNQRLNILNTASSDLTPHLKLGVGLFTQYLNKSVTASASPSYATANNVRVGIIVPPYYVFYQFKGEAALTFGLFDYAELGLSLPITYQESSDTGEIPQLTAGYKDSYYPPISALPRENTLSISDVRFSIKGRLINPEESWAHGVGLALQLTTYLPIPGPSNAATNPSEKRFNQWNSYWTSKDQKGGYLQAIRLEPRLIVDWRHAETGIKLAGNIAYRYQPKRKFAYWLYGQEIRWNVGLEVPLPYGYDWIRPELSFFGGIPLIKVEDKKEEVALFNKEWTAGVKFILPYNLVGQIGGGGGLVRRELGTPNFRLFASFGYYPTADTKDTDNDGLFDNIDRCPEQAGPIENGGCPWGDLDNDGILDNVDQCPEDPEDIDEFQDNDGCPDLDNDNDGIPDTKDQCPEDPEDIDGFQDDDGCPDLDNDNDGFPDTTDKCPNEAEIINGIDDEDGCPDKGPSKLRITETKIEILEKVFFNTGKAEIRPRSFDLLDQVATVLKNIKKITKLRVEGHTDSRGSAKSNQKLSQARADAVRDYLISKGIDANRLESKGYGEEQPIDSNKTSVGRERNRRVEFTIIEVNGKPVSTDSVTVEKREVIE